MVISFSSNYQPEKIANKVKDDLKILLIFFIIIENQYLLEKSKEGKTNKVQIFIKKDR